MIEISNKLTQTENICDIQVHWNSTVFALTIIRTICIVYTSDFTMTANMDIKNTYFSLFYLKCYNGCQLFEGQMETHQTCLFVVPALGDILHHSNSYTMQTAGKQRVNVYYYQLHCSPWRGIRYLNFVNYRHFLCNER